MSTESLNRTSNVNTINSEVVETSSTQTLRPTRIASFTTKRANMDVLKQRLFEEKKKEKNIRKLILSSVIISIGALTILTY
tara:strand:- start:70 stop:312 length:243 start_codon:yes stop_codon:yes gene_type:complete